MKKGSFVHPVEDREVTPGYYIPTSEEIAECKRILKELRDRLEKSMKQEEKK